MKAIDLFPVTIYQTKVQYNDYLKNLMLSEIMEASEYLDVPQGWSTNKLKTSFEGEPEGKEVIERYRSTLESEYTKCFEEFFDKEYRIKKSLPKSAYTKEELKKWVNEREKSYK